MPTKENLEKAKDECAFVAGATGYVGRAVVRLLAKNQVNVCAHIRPDSPELKELRSEFEGIGANVDTSAWKHDDLVESFKEKNPRVVFCLIGTTKARMKEIEEQGGTAESESYDKIDYGLTAMLVKAAQEAGITPRFVYLSALGTKPSARSAYMQARYRAEGEVLASGLPYTIARPAIITGPDRREKRPLEKLGAKILDKILSFAALLGLKKLQKIYASIDSTSLARALVSLAYNSNCENRVVEVHEIRELS